MTAYAKATAALLLLVLGFAAGWWVGAGRVQGKWDASKASIAEAQDKAIIQRVTENQALIDKYAADNTAITKAKNEEIAAVRSSLAVSMRRGAGICARAARAPEASPTGSSDAANTASGAFREDVDRDIRSAMMEMEEVASTARACQAWARSTQ